MAYVGRTERLCQAIVADDLKGVQACLAEEGSNPDRRDYTGRTPLQLACMSSTPEIVQTLVDQGARMIPRMADGKTALHIAASRGDVDIVRILLTRSNQNEEEELKKQDKLKETTLEKDSSKASPQEDEPMGDADDQDEDMSHTSASYVKVEPEESSTTYDTLEENDLEPDVYDVNVVAWDSRASPLHLAMLNGHTNVVKELVSSFGADVLMPVKILNDYNRKPEAAILNLVLAFSLPSEKRTEIFRTLLELGASPAQADLTQKTTVYYSVQCRMEELLDICFEHDMPAVKRALNHLTVGGSSWSPSSSSALTAALNDGRPEMVLKLLDAGAKPAFELNDLVKAFKAANPNERYFGGLEDRLMEGLRQPILLAVSNDLPLIAIEMLNRGVSSNTETKSRWNTDGQSLLDYTRERIQNLRNFMKPQEEWHPCCSSHTPIHFEGDDDFYLANLPSDSYRRLIAKFALKSSRKASEEAEAQYENQKKSRTNHPGIERKREAVASLILDYERLGKELLSRDAKTWRELHPDEEHHEPREGYQHKHKKVTSKTFKIEYNFSEPGLTDIRRDAYIQL